jgi:cell fate regulator YaaT (PSP1 superfamily)
MMTDPDKPLEGDESDVAGRQAAREDALDRASATSAVRYGYMNFLGEFNRPRDLELQCGARVIIKTGRGIELGEHVSLACHGGPNAVTREQTEVYIRNSGPEYYRPDSGRILREATPDDLREHEHLRRDTLAKQAACQAVADRMKLPLKVVACEHLLGGERIIFYFLAEKRVDFRALVKEMASEYQTRIEMRQVGVRDEARLLADYETCGRECCCRIFLKTLRPVSMKMAKMQKATLDPSKVSGRCGRLKCCLRYEHIAYEELDRRLPRGGTWVSTERGDGIVVNRQILTQLIQIQGKDDNLFTVGFEDVLQVGDKGNGQERPVQRVASAMQQAPTDDNDTASGDAEMPAADADQSPAAAQDSDDERSSRGRRGRRRRRKPRSGEPGAEQGSGDGE